MNPASNHDPAPEQTSDDGGGAPCYLREFAGWFEGEPEGGGMIRLKRAYDAPADEDGRRYLVDRLWPRGLKRDGARLDGWLKDLAPSAELRRWFAHDPRKWEDFRERYQKELAALDGPACKILSKLRSEAKAGPVTLVFAARDTEHNQAVVLKDFLLSQ